MQVIPDVTIVLPCYNPVSGWYANIETAIAAIGNNLKIELIIVNDGSTKGVDTAAVKELEDKSGLSLLISYQQNRGKGYALRQGVGEAHGKLVIYTDIDFPYTPDSFLKIYNTLLHDNCDVAIGIRSEEYYTHLPAARVKISKFLRFMIRFFLRIPTDDTQCGLKGFNQKGKEVFLQTTIDRYLFDLEFIFLCARKKLALKTVVVELRPGIQLSHMRLNILLQELGNFLKIFVQSIF